MVLGTFNCPTSLGMECSHLARSVGRLSLCCTSYMLCMVCSNCAMCSLQYFLPFFHLLAPCPITFPLIDFKTMHLQTEGEGKYGSPYIQLSTFFHGYGCFQITPLPAAFWRAITYLQRHTPCMHQVPGSVKAFQPAGLGNTSAWDLGELLPVRVIINLLDGQPMVWLCIGQLNMLTTWGHAWFVFFKPGIFYFKTVIP